MEKALGLTKNNDQYADVPDDLKWAIPLYEYLTSPEAIRDSMLRMALAEKRVETEFAELAKRRVKRKRR